MQPGSFVLQQKKIFVIGRIRHIFHFLCAMIWLRTEKGADPVKKEKYQSTVFGRELRKFRIRNHLTQKDLGERVGVSGNTIHLWETRVTKPNVIYLYHLSQIMNQPLSILIRNASLVWDDRINTPDFEEKY